MGSPRGRRPHRAGLVLLALLATAGMAGAQASTAPGSSGKNPASTGALPSESVIQERISRIESGTGLEEGVKAKVLETYKQALEQHRQVVEWSRKAGEFRRLKAAAPSTLAGTRKELARPVAEPEIRVDAKAGLSALEESLAAVEAELEAAQKQVQELANEPSLRAERRQAIPGLLASARERLDDVGRQIDAGAAPDELPEVTQSRMTLLEARRKATEGEIRALEAELSSYDARAELLPARQDLASRRLTRAEKTVKLWREAVDARRQQEAEQQAVRARQAEATLTQGPPRIRELAERNTFLAEMRTGPRGVAASIAAIQARADAIAQTLRKVKEDFEGLRTRIDAVGLTEAIGLLLRRRKSEIPDLRPRQTHLRERQSMIASVQLLLLELQEERGGLSALSDEVRDLLKGLEASLSPQERKPLEQAANQGLETRRQILDALLKDFNTYFVLLVDLDAAERRLIEQVRLYSDYVDEHILWVQSAPVLRLAHLKDLKDLFAWMTDGIEWKLLGIFVLEDLASHSIQALLFILLVLLIVRIRGRVRIRLKKVGEETFKNYTAPFSRTVGALRDTALLSVHGPLLMGLIGWRLTTANESAQLARVLGVGFERAAWVLFALDFLKQVCRPMGLGEAHFHWRSQTLKTLRQSLVFVGLAGIPMVMLVYGLENQGPAGWKDSVGRWGFLVLTAVVAGFAHRVMHPRRGILEEITGGSRSGWVARFGRLWHGLAVGAPFLLMLLAIVGYDYTARRLLVQLYETLCVVMAMVLLNALLIRWLFVARARLAMEQAQKRREVVEEGGAVGAAPTPEGDVTQVQEPSVDFAVINVQTRRMIRGVVGVLCLTGFLAIWSDVLPAFAVLKKVELWLDTIEVSEVVTGADGVRRVETIDKVVPVTLADLILALLLLGITILGSRNLPGLLEITVLNLLPLDSGGRYALSTITRYLITAAGLVIAFRMVGVGWSKFHWLVAAVSVGLGFGLQEIFANFVSGLIILFERPIRVGDTVTIGDVSGTVTRIRIRATTITDWNRKELIVPNREFITGRVVNWTLTESTLRVVIPVGVAYGSDTRQAETLLIDAARSHPDVLADPEPRAWFMGFGDNALDFSLRFYIPSVDFYLSATHGVNNAIVERFARAGLEIAFPQRDLHLRSSEAPITVVLKQP